MQFVEGLSSASPGVKACGSVALAAFEVRTVTLASQSVPGALGLVLRQTLYPSLLGACGRNVVFGQNVVMRHPHKIRIGDNVVIDDHCLIDAKGDSNRGISIGSDIPAMISSRSIWSWEMTSTVLRLKLQTL